jgi:hypothetical protein
MLKRYEELLPTITKDFVKADRQVLEYILNKPKVFKNYDNTDKQKLGAYLVSIAKFLGVKEALDDIQRKMLVRCLVNELNDFTLEELDKAIQMGAMGKLEVDNKHYQCITPMYLSDIVLAYKKHRGLVYKKYNQKIASIERNKPTKKISEKDKLLISVELAEAEYNDYIKDPKVYTESEYRFTQYKFIIKFLVKYNFFNNDFNMDNYTDEQLKFYIIKFFKKVSQSNQPIREYFRDNWGK